MINQFVNDILKYLPAQIVPAFIGFISIPIISRLFSPVDYGNYTLVIATIAVLMIFSSWLNMSVIRFYQYYQLGKRIDEFNNTVTFLLIITVVILSVMYLAILLIIREHISNPLWTLMLIGLPVFIISSSFQVFQQYCRVTKRISWYSYFAIWYSTSALLAGLALIIVFHTGIAGLFWGSVIGSGIALPLLIRMAVEWKINLNFRKISREITREMGRYAFPLVFGNLAAWIMILSDRYVLEYFRDSAEVGIYSISYTISQNTILIFSSLIIMAAGPIGIKIWEEQGLGKSQEFVSKVARYYLLLCLPVGTMLVVLARPLIQVLTSPDYFDGYRIMGPIAFGVFFLGFEQIFQLGLLFYKKTGYVMIAILISGLLNLGLNIWLVPLYGYFGAGVVSLISYFILFISIILVSRKYYIWKFPFKSLWKGLFACLIMGLVVFVIGDLTSSNLIYLVLEVFAGIIVYLSIILILREPEKSELDRLLTIKNSLIKWRKSKSAN